MMKKTRAMKTRIIIKIDNVDEGDDDDDDDDNGQQPDQWSPALAASLKLSRCGLGWANWEH